MLTVITGPMYSGKSTALISKCKSHAIAGNSTVVFKPSNDIRYSKEKVVTHDGVDFPSISIDKDNPIISIDLLAEDNKIVAFDEVQFFSDEILFVVENLLFTMKQQVICAGLAQDSFGEPFGAMPRLLAKADNIICLRAVCSKCKGINAATRTFRYSASTKQTLVGGIKDYTSMCFKCWRNI